MAVVDKVASTLSVGFTIEMGTLDFSSSQLFKTFITEFYLWFTPIVFTLIECNNVSFSGLARNNSYEAVTSVCYSIADWLN